MARLDQKKKNRHEGPAMSLRINIPVALMSTSPAGLQFIFHHESLKGVSEHLHWPGGASGVTLGPGYDMKMRTRTQITADMSGIGLHKVTADKIAGAAGLVGAPAQDFAEDNEDLVTLTSQQQVRLLARVVPAYEALVKKYITTGLTQYQFDALVSFCYNPGASFVPVAHAINCGKVNAAMHIIKTRIFTGSRKSVGLQHRRADEVRLYLHGTYHRHAHKTHAAASR